MHGLLVFVSLLGGMAAFGFIGLVIGPVAIAAIGTLLDAVLEDQSPHRPSLMRPDPAPACVGTAPG